MEVTYSATALKGLRKMPAKDRKALMQKLGTYAATGAGDVKKLTGQPYSRLRHGNWRAVFEIEAGILVVHVAHRSDVYR